MPASFFSFDASSLMIVAVAALVDREGRVLVQRRPAGVELAGLWEFPGGKLESGESPETALVRELGEELGIDVDKEWLAPACFATELRDNRHLVLLVFICREWRGVPAGLQAAELKWLRASELHDLEMPPADRPLIALLEILLQGSGGAQPER